MNDYKKYIRAVFVKRINRFVSTVKLKGKNIQVYVPNTGRLSELAIPGKKVILTPSNGKYNYKLLYIYHNNFPIMIDSSYSNKLFHDLLLQKMIPELKNYIMIRREPPYKNHRFDFLMEDEIKKNCFIELKSCTLFWEDIASFPDAVSSRATAHVNTLVEAGNGILIFLILRNNIRQFIPNYHTDYEFYKAVKNNQKKIKMLAYSIDYDKNFNISKIQSIPIKIPEVKPVGSYLIVLYNQKSNDIEIGKLGKIKFQKGYYIYTGSGMNNVFSRIVRHKSKSTKKHWHIDYIKDKMKIIADIPIVTEENIECNLSQEVSELGNSYIKNFGSSDCNCISHLVYFKQNPIESDSFWDMIFEKRFKNFIEEKNHDR